MLVSTAVIIEYVVNEVVHGGITGLCERVTATTIPEIQLLGAFFKTMLPPNTRNSTSISGQAEPIANILRNRHLTSLYLLSHF
jgi:hypothetical protein